MLNTCVGVNAWTPADIACLSIDHLCGCFLHALFDFTDQVRGLHAEALGKFENRAQGGSPEPPFDEGDIGTIHPELNGELLLTEFEGAAVQTKDLTEGAFESGGGTVLEMTWLDLLAHAKKLVGRGAVA